MRLSPRTFAIAIAASAVLSASPALAAQAAAPAAAAAKDEPARPVPAPRTFVTKHAGRFGGQAVTYTATAGETYLLDDRGEPKTSIFSFAYVREGVADPAGRPVTFVWNGGPGSASVWLHMGSMGPRRADVPSDARDAGPPPYAVRDNPEALLDVTDLVFVDPVGTGFSRALGRHEDKESWGLAEDAACVADFVRTWVARNGRWLSPKYLMGESFGTTRAAGVAARLEDGGLSLNGLVLISQALDYEGSSPEPGNLISFVTYLPTMAATAWYHGKAGAPGARLEDVLRDARAFALDEYAPALFKGSRLGPEERARVAKRLAALTGLTEEYVDRSDLQVLADRFQKELLRDRGLSVGRLDGRYTGEDVDRAAERPDGDPAGYEIDGAFDAAFGHYLTAELGVAMDRNYRFGGGPELHRGWKWSTAPDGAPAGEPAYVSVAAELSRAMRRNSGLRVMVAAGYYDFATPFFDAEVTFARHGFQPGRVAFRYYEAGHMMYVHGPSRERLLADVRGFIRGAAR